MSDYLGTPVQMYDSEGNKIWDCTLDIYGKVAELRGESLHECPFRFQGQYEDAETGLYYNRFRYYDANLGGYISLDPIGLEGNNPTLYGYVKNVNLWVDLIGLMPWNNPFKSGHHLVYRGKANSVGLYDLGTKRKTPTFFFKEPYIPGSHERIHAAQKKYVGPRQGAWLGTPEELLSASKKGLVGLDDIKGDLKIPATRKILASNVTPLEAFEKLEVWHNKKRKENIKKKKGKH